MIQEMPNTSLFSVASFAPLRFKKNTNDCDPKDFYREDARDAKAAWVKHDPRDAKHFPIQRCALRVLAVQKKHRILLLVLCAKKLSY